MDVSGRRAGIASERDAGAHATRAEQAAEGDVAEQERSWSDGADVGESEPGRGWNDGADGDWMSGLLILDRTDSLDATDPLYAFALDELLCRAAGDGGPAICHLWRHPRAFVMGLRDSRLPHAREAAGWLAGQGFGAAVRNSGGAAVPLDPGVVNLSLILPKGQAEDMAYRGDFERMYELIRQAVRRLGGEAAKGEVVGSYCPGDFDLSIAGRKFCGIAQRRQVKAYIVQAFVIAEGDGAARAGLVREFYRIAAEGADSAAYPAVAMDSMASLAELTGSGGRMTHGGAGTDAAGSVDTGRPAGMATRFADAVKAVIRGRQTPGGIATAEASLRLPSPEEIGAMADALRTRYGFGSQRGT